LYALPTVIAGQGEVRLLQGTLVLLPVELRTPYQIEHYATKAPKGWSRCPQGYLIYVALDDDGTKYALPGLTIEGEKRSKKKFIRQPYEFTKQNIEALCASIVQERERINAAKEAELGVLIHDLRGLSSAIYNSAESAKMACEEHNLQLAENRIESVIAAHTMLSIRIDLLDFVANRITLTNQVPIPVFRRVDKVVRCFRSKANAKAIRLDLRGASYGVALGPKIFELIPYAIIDNAIKYAPSNSDVIVVVTEDPTRIRVTFNSLGPRIDNDEVTKIFEKGYRSRHAVGAGTAGTGIGLSMAKTLLEDHFGGTISVWQRPGGAQLLETEFEIIVPLAQQER
jgi:signal transduction histidine kinase